MNTIDENSRLFLERIDMLFDELTKVKRGILAVQNGMSWDEAFDEEVYLEAKQDQKKANAYVFRIVEHLLKVKYSTNDLNINHWIQEIDNFRTKLFNLTLWGKRSSDTNLIKYIENNLQDMYDDGVDEYKKDAKEYPDLVVGLELIPEECPWSFEELMELEIEELISDKFFDDDKD